MKKILSMIFLMIFSLFVLVSCSKQCTVNFETNCEEKVESITVTEGSLITEPQLQAIDGKEVDGWYVDAQFVTKWNFVTDTVKNTMTL